MKRGRCGFTICGALFVFWATASGAAADKRAAADAVELPPFIVEEATKGPPWRYGQAAGYEVLSRCDVATTRRVLEAHHRLHQLVDDLLPQSLQLQWSLPRLLILYPEELQPAAAKEVIARMAGPQTEPPPLELELPGGRMRTAAPARRVSFLPNIRLWDRDGMAILMIVRRDGFDPERLALTFDYVNFIVRKRVPTLPAWFVTGFMALYREITFEGDGLEAKPLEWISDARADVAKADEKPKFGVAPLAMFFAKAMPRTGTERYSAEKHWAAQAELLVRWGLDPRHRARRGAFWKFVERSAVEGASEALFTQCFGFGYDAAQEQLAAFLPGVVWRRTSYRPARLAKLGRFETALASDAQVARMKGELERLEVPYVREISPELVEKYLEQARRTLRRGYERAPADPQLLAVMGLCEVDAGNDGGAKELLERAAAGGGALRPRASYELARLRLAERKAMPASGDGRIDAGQLAEVLKPLFAAREQPSPMVEVYELIGDAWAASTATPTRRHLAVLDEGVRFFPHRLPLLLRAIELNARYGFRAEAEALLTIAERVATEEVDRVAVAKARAEMER